MVVVERGSRDRRSFPVSIRDLGFLPGQYSSLVADLGQGGLIHNEIEVFTSSQNFQRDVTVEGAMTPRRGRYYRRIPKSLTSLSRSGTSPPVIHESATLKAPLVSCG